jgi:hypothetical protein
MTTSLRDAFAQELGVGKRAMNLVQGSMTLEVWVCWSMTSLTKMAHGLS